MITSTYNKEILDLSTKRINFGGVYSIAIAASDTTLPLFTVPSGYNFFPDFIGMINLTTSGTFIFKIGATGQTALSTTYYSNGNVANTVKTVTFNTQNNSRLWTTAGNNFSIIYTNSTTAFTLKMLITGYLYSV